MLTVMEVIMHHLLALATIAENLELIHSMTTIGTIGINLIDVDHTETENEKKLESTF